MTEFKLNDFDFGFTTKSENEIFGANEESLEEAREKVTTMYKMIMPLLNNLLKDADTNEYIYWPNRKEKIQSFINKLDELHKN